MSRIQQLYQAMILEHNKNPRNFGQLATPTCTVEGHNPLCGDDYVLQVQIENDTIVDVAYEGQGCAISKSSASLMSTTIKGKTIQDATHIKDLFLKLVTEDGDKPVDTDALGKLSIFEGVKKYPIRVKCATLIWRTLENALSNNTHSVSTE